MTSVGYIVVITSRKMPYVAKIVATTREPAELLVGLDKSAVITMKKKVVEPREKVQDIYKAIAERRDPINKKVFHISSAELKPYFDKMEVSKSVPRGRRNMEECFVDGQLIRHMIDLKLVNGSYANSVWTGRYSASKNAILRNGQVYTSPSGFACAHYLADRPDRETPNANGWRECEYQVDGEWRSMFNI
jgi:hypothetical protein